MAAISTVFNLLNAGDHIVSSVDLYGGTSIYLKQVADRFNIKTTFVTDVTDPANIEQAIQPNTRVCLLFIWLSWWVGIQKKERERVVYRSITFVL